nr:hypothetical protein GCM10020063_082140 [Dactylosporangium thailandense]
MTDPRLRLVNGTNLAEHGAAVLRALDEVRVIVRVGGAPTSAAPAVRLLLGLAARLFSHVEIDGEAEAGVAGTSISANCLLDRLAWLRPAPTASPTKDRVIGLGDAQNGAVTLGVGGGVFACRVGHAPQPIVDDDGPLLGLQAAVCIAVAELVKEVLAPLGMMARRLDHDLVWDLLTYRVGAVEPVVPIGRVFPRLALLGVGSVGTSVVAALASGDKPFVASVELIDPEVFDDRNPFRYPALVDDVTGSAKVGWGANLLTAAGIHTEPYVGTVDQWITSNDAPGFDGLLIASPDTVGGRRDVADVLARSTLSVGVSGMAFHLARHHAGDGLACPYCEYVSLGPATTQADVYAGQTGLEVARVLQLMQPHVVLTPQDLAVAQASGKIQPDTAVSLVGHRLDDLVARAYAEIELVDTSPTTDGGGQAFLATPYVSALAGILSATEVYKVHLGLPGVDRRLDVDLSGLPQGFTRRPSADTTGGCLCASPFRRRFARRLYQTAAPG